MRRYDTRPIQSHVSTITIQSVLLGRPGASHQISQRN